MGVIDSGCGRTIFGLSTLRSFESMWKQLGWSIPPWLEEVHQFKFGNGNIETSRQSVQMPVTLANKRGVVKAAVIQGDAPLLLSRSALKALGAVLDFQRDELNVFCKSIPLKTKCSWSVCDPVGRSFALTKETTAAVFTEVMALETAPDLDSPPVELVSKGRSARTFRCQ